MKRRGFEVVSGFEEKAIIPKRATVKSAGYDFAIAEEVTIKPGETVLAKTGIKAYMKDDELLKLFVRSSLAIKRNIILANATGIIDADYYNNESNEGHILVALTNIGQDYQVLVKGERVAQGIFEKYLTADHDEITTKRTGGFGSTNR